MNNTLITNYKRLINTSITILVSIIGAVSIDEYLENTYVKESSSGIIVIVFSVILFLTWKKVPCNKQFRYYCINVLYSIVFSFFMVCGQKLDYGGFSGLINLLFLCLGMSAVVIPIVLCLESLINEYLKSTPLRSKKVLNYSFLVVIFTWVLGYMAAFPGIYAVDAMTWYLEFSDPSFPISAQWSPPYAGLFYLFVSTSYRLLGSYGPGLALFTALQVIFLLWIIRKILAYVYELGGNNATILASVFFAFVPTHIIIAVSTLQGAPFMGCFAMIILHICRMVSNPDSYWSNKRNLITFILWGVAACILRNNAYFAFILFLIFIPFYTKMHRRKLLLSMIIIIVITSIYKGPVLDSFGVMKGTSLREMMSMPLQQMACVYLYYPANISSDDRDNLEKYVNRDALQTYSSFPSISDALKSNLDVDLLESDPVEFIKLYLSLGTKAPVGYLQAAYMQDLGLCYIDKSYPDPRTWHPFINYASYDLPDEKYIKIERHSLFPLYDRLLRKLFGYAENGYGGEVETVFSEIPLLSIACRVSTYFWLLLYLMVLVIIRKAKRFFIPIGIFLCYTFTILIGPLITYRYYAPVVFAMPVLLSYVFRFLRDNSKCSYIESANNE